MPTEITNFILGDFPPNQFKRTKLNKRTTSNLRFGNRDRKFLLGTLRKHTKSEIHILQQLLLQLRRDYPYKGNGVTPFALIRKMLGENVSRHTLSMAILDGTGSIS